MGRFTPANIRYARGIDLSGLGAIGDALIARKERKAQNAYDERRNALYDVQLGNQGYTRQPDELVKAGAPRYMKTRLSQGEQQDISQQAGLMSEKVAADALAERRRQAARNFLTSGDRQGLYDVYSPTEASSIINANRPVAAPTPHYSRFLGPDGKTYRWDPTSGQAAPVEGVGRAPAKVGGGKPLSSSDQEQEAQGLAILNDRRDPKMAAALGRLFGEARKAGSTLTPGRLALSVYRAYMQSHPRSSQQGSMFTIPPATVTAPPKAPEEMKEDDGPDREPDKDTDDDMESSEAPVDFEALRQQYDSTKKAKKPR